MADCLFCKIASGEVPSSKVAEDESHLAFLDIGPLAPGHALLITKKHYERLESVPPEEIGGYAIFLQKCARAVVAATGADGYNILVNGGRAAGQLIPHVHFHIIPRFSGDPLQKAFNHSRGKYPEGKDREFAEKIRAEFEKIK